MVYNVMDIANRILAKADPDCGDVISNLKLQKLLYYMQGFHLAFFDEPLFEEDIRAWQHGPVVPSVYHKYKDFGSNGITPPDPSILIELSDEEESVFDQVYNAYGQFSPLKLRDMTHNEMPWSTTRINDVISAEKLKAYFNTQIEV